jgi:membrane-bound lytic murein transglycosylase D
VFSAFVALGILLSPQLAPQAGEVPSGLDGQLSKNLEFWINVYSKYESSQGFVHDAKYVDVIYEVLEIRPSWAKSIPRIRASKVKWRNTLLAVHKKQDDPSSFTAEEKKVYDLFAKIEEPNKFLNAAHRKRMRFQLGQRDRFLEGIYESGRYLPRMELIFKEHGLPLELTRLPFVESSFNVKARSKVGASGIWQFMPSTGRLFMNIDDVVDERNDPILATEAAAKLFKLNYDSLGNWPLAVTAYNHGRIGMMRAIRKVGSEDLDEVVRGYRSRTFGFASSNFFASFLAAVEVERNAEKYFGTEVKRAEPIRILEVVLPDSVRLATLKRFLKLDGAKIKALNPALSPAVLQSHAFIPAGYPLRLPWDGKTDKEHLSNRFFASYSKIPGMYKRKVKRVITSEAQASAR